MGLVLRLKRWWGHGSVGALEWMEDMMAEVVLVVSGDQVVMVWLLSDGWLRSYGLRVAGWRLKLLYMLVILLWK